MGSIRLMSLAAAMSPASGSMMPKVPQLVPVANAMAQGEHENHGGQHFHRQIAIGQEARYLPVSTSRTTAPMVQANSRMLMAGSMAMIPCGAAFISCLP